MRRTHQIRVATEIAAPAVAVWERVSAHEDTASWIAPVKNVKLVRTGEPRNGIGAIRVVEFGPPLRGTIHEEVTYFVAPHAFHYVLFKGLPALVSHLGKVIVDDFGNGRSRLRWEVDFVFRTWHPFRLLVPSFLRTFHDVLTSGLANLKSQLEGGANA
jgi:hypothetical protein